MKDKDIINRLKSYPQQGKIIEDKADTGLPVEVDRIGVGIKLIQ